MSDFSYNVSRKTIEKLWEKNISTIQEHLLVKITIANKINAVIL